MEVPLVVPKSREVVPSAKLATVTVLSVVLASTMVLRDNPEGAVVIVAVNGPLAAVSADMSMLLSRAVFPAFITSEVLGGLPRSDQLLFWYPCRRFRVSL